MLDSPQLFTVAPQADEPLLAAVERGMNESAAPLLELPTLTNLAQSDPYFAEQLAALHRSFELRPASGGLLTRLRTRLAWWLFGREIQQLNQTNATLVRIIDSLVVQLDQERAARQRLVEDQTVRDE